MQIEILLMLSINLPNTGSIIMSADEEIHPWGADDPLAQIVSRAMSKLKEKQVADTQKTPVPEPTSAADAVTNTRKEHHHRKSRSHSRERSHSRSRSPPNKHASHSRDRSRSPPRHKKHSSHHDSSSAHHRYRHGHHHRSSHSSHRDSGSSRRKSPSPTVDPQFNFTAAQVVEHFLEVYQSASRRRIDELLECFDLKRVCVRDLEQQSELTSSSQLKDLLSAANPQKSMPTKRLFFESKNSKDSTFALDFYAASSCPSIVSERLEGPNAVLYRVNRNRIDQIWIIRDQWKLTDDADATQEIVTASPLYELCLESMIRPGGLTAEFTVYYNNYSTIATWG